MQPGSLLECINKDGWICDVSNKTVKGPDFEEIVTFESPDPDPKYKDNIFLVEYGYKCGCGCGNSASMPAELFREIQPPIKIDIESFISEQQTV